VGDAAERVDVLRRRQPLKGEVLQPPQLQPLSHHRVQASQKLVLRKSRLRAAKGERVDRRHAEAARGPGDRDHDPVQRLGRFDACERCAQHSGEFVVRWRLPRAFRVEVEHGNVVARERRGMSGEGTRDGVYVVEVDIGGSEVALPPLERVARHQQLLPRGAHGLEALERAQAVVATRHGLDEHAPERRRGATHARDEQRREGPRARHERRNAPVAISALGVHGQRRELCFHLGVDAIVRRCDDRLVEGAVADLAREIGHHRVTALRRDNEVVEDLAEVCPGSGERGDTVEAALEDGHDGAACRRGALLSEVEAIARLLQGGGAVEVSDPIVSERSAQKPQERLGQAGRLGLERAQPSMEMLLRAAKPLRAGVLVVTRARQRAHIGEHTQEPMLAGEQRGIVVRVADDPFDVARVDVIAEHQPFEAGELVADGGRGRRRGERDALDGGRRQPAVERLERDQWRLRRHVDVRAGQHLAHPPVER
jgi:hypothetical protein